MGTKDFSIENFRNDISIGDLYNVRKGDFIRHTNWLERKRKQENFETQEFLLQTLYCTFSDSILSRQKLIRGLSGAKLIFPVGNFEGGGSIAAEYIGGKAKNLNLKDSVYFFEW